MLSLFAEDLTAARFEASIGRLPLRDREGTVVAYAIVDAADFEWLSRWRWCRMGTGRNPYAHRRQWDPAIKTNETVVLHRFLLGLTPGDPQRVDHVNRDKLDCRRGNLRFATHAQNAQNYPVRRDSTSGYRGVTRRSNGRWGAHVRADGARRNLGTFDTREQAATAAAEARARLMPFSTD